MDRLRLRVQDKKIRMVRWEAISRQKVKYHISNCILMNNSVLIFFSFLFPTSVVEKECAYCLKKGIIKCHQKGTNFFIS